MSCFRIYHPGARPVADHDVETDEAVPDDIIMFCRHLLPESKAAEERIVVKEPTSQVGFVRDNRMTIGEDGQGMIIRPTIVSLLLGRTLEKRRIE